MVNRSDVMYFATAGLAATGVFVITKAFSQGEHLAGVIGMLPTYAALNYSSQLYMLKRRHNIMTQMNSELMAMKTEMEDLKAKMEGNPGNREFEATYYETGLRNAKRIRSIIESL